MLATPLGIRVGYEALSWGRHVSDFELSWDCSVPIAPIWSLHRRLSCVGQLRLNGTNFDALATIPGERIAFVCSCRIFWKAVRTPEERIETARHLRVSPARACTARSCRG